jgi:hypothetical protein
METTLKNAGFELELDINIEELEQKIALDGGETLLPL